MGDDAAAVFPYLLVFYLVSIFVSIFSSVWRGFFYWPGFNAGVVLFALLSLGSRQVEPFWVGLMGSENIKEIWNEARDISRGKRYEAGTITGKGTLFFQKILGIALYVAAIPKILAIVFYAAVTSAWKKVLVWKRNLGISGYFKLAAILLILAIFPFQSNDIYSFFILLFGLISVLFGLDMRISAGFAIVFLVATPIFLAFNRGFLAETMAIYAFYFLVIAVFTGIGDFVREKSVFLRTESTNKLSTGQ